MIGAIVGDVAGSRFEWCYCKSKQFTLLKGRDEEAWHFCHFTDDSVMTLAVAEAIMKWREGGGSSYASLSTETVKCMQSFGRRYPNAGYGGSFWSTGVMAKGMPTSYAAPVAEGAFAVAGTCPVWRSQSGHTYGQAFEPLYATAPQAAAKDRELYDRLAVIDMLRGGRLRERKFAESKIMELIP